MNDRPPGDGLEALEQRNSILERAILALLAQHIIEETVSPGASIKRFEGPDLGDPPPGICQVCLEHVEEWEEYYVLVTMDRHEHPLHRKCLDEYMESQVQSHGRGRTNNLSIERPGRPR